MKFLYHHRVGSKDGQIVHIEEIVRALSELGHQVVVVGPPALNNKDFGADSGIIASLKRFLPARCYELLEFGYGIFAFVRIWQAYRHERPDVIYERYNLYLLAGAWLRRLVGVPLLLEVNAPLVAERSQFGGLANRGIARWAESSAWRAANYVLPVTKVLAQFVEDVGVESARIAVIQNGVGSEFLGARADPTVVKERFNLQDCTVLGFTGFMREWHRLERVIDFIADQDPSRRLRALLVGDGPAVPFLKDYAKARGMQDRVIFVGLISRVEIADYVAAFDVAMQPHVVPYASPLKLFEYMALSRAIIAPATDNIREVLTDGTDAVLFDPCAQNGFASALKRLSGDKALRDSLGRAARETLERSDFTWRGNAKKIVRFAERAIATRAQREPVQEVSQ